jgi:head-tail adaptor
VEIGKMRDTFSIETPTTLQDKYNETQTDPINGWRQVSEVRGYLRTLSGRQLQLAQASIITSTATHLISMRYTPDINIDTRLSLTAPDGSLTVYRINHIDDIDNRHVELLLTVTSLPKGAA